MQYMNGMSSLFFLLPLAYIENRLTQANVVFLTIASFLNNACTTDAYKVADHLFIYTTCMSVIRNQTINTVLTAFGVLELALRKQITQSKNLAYAMTYLYYFYRGTHISRTDVLFVITASLVYVGKTNYPKYQFSGTLLWHAMIAYELFKAKI